MSRGHLEPTSLPYPCRQYFAMPLVCCYVVAKNTQFILAKNTGEITPTFFYGQSFSMSNVIW